MNDAAVIEDLAIEVPRAEVLRYLGYPRAASPSTRVSAALDELWPEAIAMLRPRGAYRLVDAGAATAAGMPRPTPVVGVGLCTIGPVIEAAERARSRADRMLDALLLDAVGSAAAEAAADALDLELCRAARAAGLSLGHRISPGYGRWEISGQPQLLSLLPVDKLGVELTAGLMMIPRKSVSFAAPATAGEGGRGRSSRQRCGSCDLEGCRYRWTDRDPPDAGEPDHE